MLISPTELHQPIIDPQPNVYKRIVVWVSGDFLAQLAGGDSLLDCFKACGLQKKNLLRLGETERRRVFDLAMGLFREHESSERFSSAAAAGLLSSLMVEINRLVQTKGLADEQSGNPLIRDVLAFINQNLSSDLPLTYIADRFYISVYHLSHCFKSEMGTSVHRYIVQRRLIYAKQLMAEGESPTGIYRRCGFADYSTFYRAFRSEYGISPRGFADTAGIW